MGRGPNYEPPHVEIERRKQWQIDRDARDAALEAKYGVDLEKIPAVLTRAAPTHPRHTHARRFNYRVYDRAWRIRTLIEERRSGHQRNGWRTERQHYLAEVEHVRQAEIAVRKLRTKRTGRGKPLHRKAHVDARYRMEARTWREEL